MVKSLLHIHYGMQTQPKKKLTPEEAAQAAEDLRKKIKAKNQVCLQVPSAVFCPHRVFQIWFSLSEPLCIRREANCCQLCTKAVVMLQKEEAELEKLREKERIRSGKELLEAKRKEDDLKLKRNLEMRRIEKEEEQRARDRIRVKLGQHSAIPPPLANAIGHDPPVYPCFPKPLLAFAPS